jgi:Ca2+-binding EF-hand superfamily protein
VYAPCARSKLKVHELFVHWLVKPENTAWLGALLDDVRAGNDTALLAAAAAYPSAPSATGACVTSSTTPSTPGSPVSRLLHSQLPFGGSPRKFRLAGSPSALKSPSPFSADLDLGRSYVDHHVPSPSSSSAPLTNLTSESDAGAVTPATTPGVADDAVLQSQNLAAIASDSSVDVGKKASCTVPVLVDQQVMQRRALDSVADGIAGMKADATPSPIDIDDSPDQPAVTKTSIVETEDICRLADPSLSPDQPALVSPPRCNLSSDATIPQANVMLEADANAGTGAPVSGTGSSASDRSRIASATRVTVTAAASTTVEYEPQLAGTDMLPHPTTTDDLMDVDSEPAPSTLPSATAVATVGVSSATHTLCASLPPRPICSIDMNMTTDGDPRKVRLPPFYFPRGKDAIDRENREYEAIGVIFGKFRETKGGIEGVTRSEFDEIVVHAIGLPRFFAPVIFDRIIATPSTGLVDVNVESHREGDSVSHGSGSTNSQALITIPAAPATMSMEDVDARMTSITDGIDGAGMRCSRGGIDSDNLAGLVQASTSSKCVVNGNGNVSVTSGSAMAVEAAVNAADVGAQGHLPGACVLLTEDRFREYYAKEVRGKSRETRLFYSLRELGAERDFLVPSDFKPLLRALLLCHQGLAFLHATPEFQLRYSETVIERIYFSCTRKHNGRLTIEDIRRSRLLDTFISVDEEEDINRERRFFSYEHFYVLYCRFWELDTDHDLQIDREDLMRYGGHSLTYRIVDRIFGGYARRLDNADHPGYMSYTDFIWFCLSEEDKNSPTAIDYWYRCIDMDGDGLITMFDMEFFYKEQLHRMECFGHEPVQIRDILCQLLDMVKPNSKPPQVTRQSLKNSSLSSSFYNVLFNLNKFFALEARDPIQIRQEHATPELTDWDRFAALEYLRLSAEEEGEEDESWDNNPLIVGEAPF